MKDNKNHWYDGHFYDRIIAPNQDRLFANIKNMIEPGCVLLDVGCGTGRMAFQLENHCGYIKGIDLSDKNIALAKENLGGENKKIEFVHGNALELNDGRKYDYAVLTYVIHEMDYQDRISLLKGLKNVADKIIIGEYMVPHPKGFWGSVNFVVEFLAGADHFKNFKHFINNGGVESLAQEAGFEIEKKILNNPKTSCTMVLKALA